MATVNVDGDEVAMIIAALSCRKQRLEREEMEIVERYGNVPFMTKVNEKYQRLISKICSQTGGEE